MSQSSRSRLKKKISRRGDVIASDVVRREIEQKFPYKDKDLVEEAGRRVEQQIEEGRQSQKKR
jgi:hypothetical protein